MIPLAAMLLLQGAAPQDTPVASLMGRSPTEVARALGSSGPTGIEPVVIVENGRRVEVYPGDAFRPPAPEGMRCATQVGVAPTFDGGVGLQSLRTRARFVFRDGGLVAVREPPIRHTAPAPPRESHRQMVERFRQGGAVTDWSVATGRLPLSDGAAFADRTTGLAPVGSVVFTRCEPRPIPPATTQPRPFDSAGFLQGLALLPFVVLLPALNAERERDAVAGPALLASVQPGDVMADGAEAFVRGRSRVRLYRDDDDPDYGVIVVSVGNPSRNNLGRFNDVGMIGVRGDRVVWKASPETVEALGLKTPMCIGRDGRLDRVRPGCSNTGYFVFGD